MKPGTQLEIAFFLSVAMQGAGVYILANLGAALILVGTEVAIATLWGMRQIVESGTGTDHG